MTWLPIRYAEFYDVPRAFAIEHEGDVLVFNCPFDDEADDYATLYRAYRIPDTSLAALEHLSLNAMVEQGRPIGSVAAEAIRFDPTLRGAVDSSFLTTL